MKTLVEQSVRDGTAVAKGLYEHAQRFEGGAVRHAAHHQRLPESRVDCACRRLDGEKVAAIRDVICCCHSSKPSRLQHHRDPYDSPRRTDRHSQIDTNNPRGYRRGRCARVRRRRSRWRPGRSRRLELHDHSTTYTAGVWNLVPVRVSKDDTLQRKGVLTHGSCRSHPKATGIQNRPVRYGVQR